MPATTAALSTPPSRAAPTELPISRISRFAAVALARRSHVTVAWIVTTEDVLMKPMATPIPNEAAATHTGPSSGRRNRYMIPPTAPAAPPMRAVLAGPSGISSRPQIEEATGQPSDIVERAKPATSGAAPLTPRTDGGTHGGTP